MRVGRCCAGWLRGRCASRSRRSLEKPVAATVVGGHQCAVGTAGGVEKLQNILAAEAEARPDALIISLDFVNAFNSVLRSAVREAV